MPAAASPASALEPALQQALQETRTHSRQEALLRSPCTHSLHSTSRNSCHDFVLFFFIFFGVFLYLCLRDNKEKQLTVMESVPHKNLPVLKAEGSPVPPIWRLQGVVSGTVWGRGLTSTSLGGDEVARSLVSPGKQGSPPRAPGAPGGTGVWTRCWTCSGGVVRGRGLFCVPHS